MAIEIVGGRLGIRVAIRRVRGLKEGAAVLHGFIARRPLLNEDGCRRRLAPGIVNTGKIVPWRKLLLFFFEGMVVMVESRGGTGGVERRHLRVLVVGVGGLEVDMGAGLGSRTGVPGDLVGSGGGGNVSCWWWWWRRGRRGLAAGGEGKNRGGVIITGVTGQQEEVVKGVGDGEKGVRVGGMGVRESKAMMDGGGKEVGAATTKGDRLLLVHLRPRATHHTKFINEWQSKCLVSSSFMT